MKVIGVDFETFFDTKQGYGIRELGTWRYLHDDRFDPYLISVCDGSTAWAGHPRHFNWNSLEGARLVSHNRSFDNQVYNAAVEKLLAPRVKYHDWHCTANLSVYLCNRRALADASSFLLHEQVCKDVRNDANGKTSDQLRADVAGWNRMLAYGRNDAFLCWKLWDRFSDKWPENERRLSQLTIDQGIRGVQIDRVRLDKYLSSAHDMLKRAERTLPWIEAGSPPTSPKAIAEHCRRCGIPGPPVKSRDGEEAFIQWEAEYGPKNPWIANVANWRSINKFLDSLTTIKQRLEPDEVLGFGLKYFGAHTGRWSGDAGLNLQNLRKEPLYRDENGFLISDQARLDEIARELVAAEKAKREPALPGFVTGALDIRSLFIPRRGKKMIVCDLSQIEPRVLAWVTHNAPMLARMAAGESPYEAFARTGMNPPWTGGDLKKEDKNRYALSKAQVLGLGYQCAWEKFILVAQTMAGIDITKDDPEFVQEMGHTEDGELVPMLNADNTPKMVSGYGSNSKRIVAEYRANNPLIVALWNRLDQSFKDSVGQDFEMKLPSGRWMIYRDVRQEWKSTMDPKTLKFKRRLVTTAEVVKNGVVARQSIYGGMITENLVQATARDIFGEQLLDLNSTSGIDVLFSSHDESINETDQHVTKKDVEEIMSRPPSWLRGCPLAAEGKETPHYLK